jgi:hypothetical protein
MSEFVYLFRSTEEAQPGAMGTPEQAQRSMEAWLAWIRRLEDAGHLRSAGQPLERTGSVVRKGMVTDGPYAESKEIVLGFIVVEAKDMAQAVELAKGCPMVLGGGGDVEVRPVMAGPL